MAGLLQDSLNAGAQSTSGLEQAADQSARQYIQNIGQKAGIEEGIGSLAGTVGGIAIAKETYKPPQAKANAATPDSQTHGPSMMMGTLMKRLHGGLLNNQAPTTATANPGDSGFGLSPEDH